MRFTNIRLLKLVHFQVYRPSPGFLFANFFRTKNLTPTLKKKWDAD